MFFLIPKVLATNFLYSAVRNETLIPIEFVNVLGEDAILLIAMKDIMSQFPIANNRICDSYYFIVSRIPCTASKPQRYFAMFFSMLRRTNTSFFEP
jgi:hypothetical protein